MSPESSARITVDTGDAFSDIALDHDKSLFIAKTPTTENDPLHNVIAVNGSLDRQATRHQSKP